MTNCRQTEPQLRLLVAFILVYPLATPKNGLHIMDVLQ